MAQQLAVVKLQVSMTKCSRRQSVRVNDM